MNTQLSITGDGDTRRTLVVVFLRGGADGLSLVAPVEEDAYHRARPRLAIRKKEAVALDALFGLNPMLRDLEPFWKSGEMAIVHAAGTEDQSRSHFEAQDLMEHGGLAAGGWLGRFLRARPEPASGALACVAVGRLAPESLLGAPSATVMESLDDFSLGSASGAFSRELEKLYGADRGGLGTAARDTFDALARIDKMRTENYRPSGGAAYETDPFAQGLQQIARLIKANVGLEAASIDIGGWDSHFTQQTLLEPLISRLGKGISAFCRDLGSALKTTTVVVMTEFGRRVQENSAFGTDHGRGSAMFVLGGEVRGGRMIGKWPGLEDKSLEGPGDVPVVHNYRNVLAPLLERHGASAEALRAIFPDFALSPLDLYG